MTTCFLNGLCGRTEAPSRVKQAIEDPVLAPFAEVQIRGSDKAKIGLLAGLVVSAIYGSNPVHFSVGNKSQPAIIKSLVVGASSAMGAEIEIVDQDGGDFSRIFEKISRMGAAGADQLLWLRWGWSSGRCTEATAAEGLAQVVGGLVIPATSTVTNPSQQPAAGMITNWQSYIIMNVSVDYSAGIVNSAGTVKYTIKCVDILGKLSITTVKWNYPGSFFVDAVNAVCEKLGLGKAEFVAYDEHGTKTDFKFKNNGGTIGEKKGLLNNYEGKDEPVQKCFERWLSPHSAVGGTHGLGIRVFTDTDPINNPNGKILFLAGTASAGTCNENQFDKLLVASYFVNAGGCSPVISFKPTIEFSGVNAYTTGGTASAASAAGTTPARGPTPCLGNAKQRPDLYNNFWKGLGVGLNVALTITRGELLGRLKKAVQMGYDAMYLNSMANVSFKPITAELRVQGDPTYDRPALFIMSKFINLTVINPFQIDSPCEWTNTHNPCNEILTNGAWLIVGVSHDLRDGSYTTVLKISLATPGYDLSLYDASLGGPNAQLKGKGVI